MTETDPYKRAECAKRDGVIATFLLKTGRGICCVCGQEITWR
jgi:hypothetical protein